MSGPRNTQFNPLPRWLLLLFLLQIKEEEKKEQKLSNSLHLVASFFFKIKSFFIEGLVKWTEEENYNGGNVIGWISAWSIKTWRQTRGYEWWSLCVLVNGFARSAIGFSHTNHTWWIENEFKGVCEGGKTREEFTCCSATPKNLVAQPGGSRRPIPVMFSIKKRASRLAAAVDEHERVGNFYTCLSFSLPSPFLFHSALSRKLSSLKLLPIDKREFKNKLWERKRWPCVVVARTAAAAASWIKHRLFNQHSFVSSAPLSFLFLQPLHKGRGSSRHKALATFHYNHFHFFFNPFVCFYDCWI